MNDQIVLIDIEGYNKVTGQVETLRYCDGVAYRLRPTEAPANALYRPFLLDAGWSRIDVYTAPGQYGRVTPGEIVLDDSSGLLGIQLIDYAFDGRSIVQRIGRRGDPFPSGFVTVLNGTIAGPPSFDWNKITFHPADLASAQAKPLQTVRYGGTNVLPNGIDGLDDLRAKVKPIVLALASNMTPVLCNTSLLIYQVSIAVGGLRVAVNALRDGGVPWTAGASYASMAEMLATAPAAGQYRVLSNTVDGCFIRLGSQPARGITCDAAYGAAADRTHAQVWRRVLNYAGVANTSIALADLAVLDAALPAEIEFALFDAVQVDAALSEIANSAGAAWYGDQAGKYRLVAWSVPAGEPVAVITALRTADMDIDDPIGNGGVAPAYLVNLSYGRNWTPQVDSALGGDKASTTDPVRAPGGRAGLLARAWLAKEYRVAPSLNAAVQTAHKSAIVLELTSLIADATAAQAFCDAQRAAYSVARPLVPLTAWLSQEQIDVVRANSVIRVQQDRWNYGSGRLVRVAGALIDLQTQKTELTIWG